MHICDTNASSVCFVYSAESIHPFCDRVKPLVREKSHGLQTECTQQRDAMAVCNLIDYGTPLPLQYQVLLALHSNSSVNILKRVKVGVYTCRQ